MERFADRGLLTAPGQLADGHGRRHRSFDRVHDRGPLPGSTVNWQSRPRAAAARTSKRLFNLQGSGFEGMDAVMDS